MSARYELLRFLMLALGASVAGSRAGAQGYVSTGTVDSTPRNRVPFSVTVLDSTTAWVAPTASPLALLSGRIPGLRTLGVSNQPGVVPSLVLRSAASRGAEPLLVIDGVPSRLSSSDLSAEEVERVEVIGGGAAGAIYGADAANGVIHVITKSGKRKGSNGPAFSLRTEMGQNARPPRIPGSTHHNYRMNASGTGYLRDSFGNVQYDPDGIADNPYPATGDLQSYLVDARRIRSAHLSATDRIGSTSYYVSVHQDQDPGFFRMLSGLSRQNVRLNLDHSVGSRLEVSANALMARSHSDLTESEVSWLTSARFLDPDLKLDSMSSSCPTGIATCYFPVIERRALNPLYDLQSADRNDRRTRTIGTLRATYRFLSWLSARATYSNDQLSERARRTQFIPTIGTPVDVYYSDVERLASAQHFVSTSVALNSTHSWFGGAVGQHLSLAWMDERQSLHDNAERSTQAIGSPVEGGFGRGESWDDRLAGLVLATQLDVGTRLMVDGAARREASRRFNTPDARVYHRFGVSYVLRDSEAGAWRLRAMHGTAAQPVPRLAQPKLVPMDLYSASPLYLYGGGVPMTRETEFGLDGRLPFGIDLSATYSDKTSVELFAMPVQFFSFTFLGLENVGKVKGKTLEVSLGADVFRRATATWHVAASASRTRSRFKLSTFERAYGPQGAFHVRDGDEVGNIYGFRWIRTQAQLEQTIASDYLPGPVDAYRQNEDGYYVRSAQYHTPTEEPLVSMGCQIITGCPPAPGVPRPPVRLGNTTPNVELGLNNVASWRSLSAHATIVAALGGEVLNYARRRAMVLGRDPLVDQSGRPEAANCPQTVPADPCAYSTGKKPLRYYQILANGINENFVEDGTFGRVRELGLEWRVPRRWLTKLPLSVKGARVSVIGRNLWTLTGYSGVDPDVATRSDGALLYRVDDGAYPAYRSLSASLTLDF